ncbi:MAG TPA: hypothetical protein VLB80_03985 [Candidatus Babeliales bacterium]|nr:hypothetical protein [Candidatus Babeliales bacterium]
MTSLAKYIRFFIWISVFVNSSIMIASSTTLPTPSLSTTMKSVRSVKSIKPIVLPDLSKIFNYINIANTVKITQQHKILFGTLGAAVALIIAYSQKDKISKNLEDLKPTLNEYYTDISDTVAKKTNYCVDQLPFPFPETIRAVSGTLKMLYMLAYKLVIANTVTNKQYLVSTAFVIPTTWLVGYPKIGLMLGGGILTTGWFQQGFNEVIDQAEKNKKETMNQIKASEENIKKEIKEVSDQVNALDKNLSDGIVTISKKIDSLENQIQQLDEKTKTHHNELKQQLTEVKELFVNSIETVQKAQITQGTKLHANTQAVEKNTELLKLLQETSLKHQTENQKEFSELNIKVQELSTLIQSTTDEIKQLNTDVTVKVDNINEKIDKTNVLVKDIDGKVDTVSNKITGLNDKLEKASKQLIALSEKIDKRDKTDAAQDQKVEELLGQLKNSQEQLIAAKGELNNTVTNLVDKFEESTEQIREQLKKYQNQLSCAMTNQNDENKKINELINKVFEKESDNTTLLQSMKIVEEANNQQLISLSKKIEQSQESNIYNSEILKNLQKSYKESADSHKVIFNKLVANQEVSESLIKKVLQEHTELREKVEDIEKKVIEGQVVTQQKFVSIKEQLEILHQQIADNKSQQDQKIDDLLKAVGNNKTQVNLLAADFNKAAEKLGQDITNISTDVKAGFNNLNNTINNFGQPQLQQGPSQSQLAVINKKKKTSKKNHAGDLVNELNQLLTTDNPNNFLTQVESINYQ